METYDDPTCCDHALAPAPVETYEPAPVPAYAPPAPVAPAAEIFPEVPAAPVAAAPVANVTPAVEAPLPQPAAETVQPLAPAPLSSGTLLGPSTVGGSADLGGSGFAGAGPSLVGSTTVGGSFAPDLGGTWLDSNGTPVAAPHIPVVPGPFGAAAAGIVNTSNAAIVDGLLGGSAPGVPAPWTPGFDSDRDGILNERDANPRDRFA